MTSEGPAAPEPIGGVTSGLVATRGVLRPMLILAWPVLLQQLLDTLVGFVDMWLAGYYLRGEAYLAAMGLLAYILWMLANLFAAVAIGAGAMVARYAGAGDREHVSQAAHQALLLGLLVAGVATPIALVFREPFIALLQLRGEAAALASQYLVIIIPVLPLLMLEQVGIACLQGAGDTVTGFIAKTVMNAVNLVVSYALVAGAWGLPTLGWQGLAIGTACGHLACGAVILAALLRGRGGVRLQWRRLRPDRNMMRRLLAIGLPGGVDVAAILCCHLWFLSIVNHLGPLAAAAHAMAIRIESLAYLPGTAFQVSAATLAGQYLGARDPGRATRAVLASVLAGGAVMSAAGLLFYFGSNWLPGLFIGGANPPAQELTAPLLRIVALGMPSLALNNILTGALRGAGDTRGPLAITFLGYLGVRMPLAYWLAWSEIPLPLVGVTIAGWGLGVTGCWIAMVADIIFRSVLVVARFAEGSWRRIEV